jgi:SAM-dependent methyltransferase
VTVTGGSAANGVAMPDVYCVTGYSVILAGEVLPGAGSFSLPVLAANGEVTRLHCASASGVGEVTVSSPSGLAPAELGEAIRLFLRLAVKLYGDLVGSFRVVFGSDDHVLDSILAEDGLTRHNEHLELSHRTADLTRNNKAAADDMEAVYADPLTVPWNFVPVTTDLIDPLLAAIPAGSRVLDLGCGFGKNLRYLVANGIRASGIDIAARAAERAREVANGSAEVVVGSACALPWPEGSFDAVLDAGCLHCLPASSRPIAVREAARVLVDDGCLYSGVLPPKDPDWLNSLPFVTDELGMRPAQARALIDSAFGTVAVSPHPHITNLVASDPRRDIA